jgi:CheY-like chemotaxis protein
MTKEQLDKLFEEYHRFNVKANRTIEGTGLGMSITNNLISLMNGSIDIESEAGVGSVFTVRVPQGVIGNELLGTEMSENLSKFKAHASAQMRQMQIMRDPMPYGRVLIVDDVETNIYVARGLLMPYELKIDSADSGFEAIDKIGSGEVYDIIFMDHMMPKMDGMEATKIIRDMGYTNTIVALTANAVMGQAEVFLENGFNDFISKPIDIRHMNTILRQYIRDKYPEEAEKYKPVSIQAEPEPAEGAKRNITETVDPRLLKIFMRDAEKVLGSIYNTYESGDIKLLITSVHAMKAALGTIGEDKMSAMAGALEAAGLRNDTEYIDKKLSVFVESLEQLLEFLKNANLLDEDVAESDEVQEDVAFLKEKLEEVIEACENYDDSGAYKVLDILKDKAWKKETSNALDEIRDMLYYNSDFEAASDLVSKTLSMFN